MGPPQGPCCSCEARVGAFVSMVAAGKVAFGNSTALQAFCDAMSALDM
jgi:hypothetical protein